MKKHPMNKPAAITAALAILFLTCSLQGALYTSTYTIDQDIPDGSVVGWSDTQNVDFFNDGFTITDLKVSFTIDNGYNGDLYAYLAHGDRLVVLLDRVGSGSGAEPQYTFGFSTSGFGSVTLWDGAGAGIHNIPDPAGGTWKPNGAPSSSSTLASHSELDFLGVNPNGQWTLFFADHSQGATSHLVNWGLEISAVPEPVTVALGALALLFALSRLPRYLRRNRAKTCPPVY